MSRVADDRLDIEERALLAAVIETSTDALITTDLHGVVASWNPAAERLFGYKASEIVGQNVERFVPPALRADQRVRLARARQGAELQTWDTERVRADGRAIPVAIALTLLRDGQGRPTGLSAILSDLTERRHLEREQGIAETLQRSLLPPIPPSVDGLSFAARYLPGGAGLAVGGDWYDVFALPGDLIGIAIGDVIGRGVAAAAAMGQLRTALRAFALDGAGPKQVVDSMQRLLQSFSDTDMATMLYGVIDLTRERLRVANAGHPPPLLVGPGGTASYLALTVAPPLGVPGPAAVETDVALAIGHTLLLYTDGLVERRGTPLGEGLDALRRAAGDAWQLGPDQLCDRVIEAMDAGESSDDVALLALTRYA